MNEYETVDEMWAETIREIMNQGQRIVSRNGGSTEIVGWSGKLMNPLRNLVLNPARCISPTYAAAELLWYLSGTRTTDMIVTYAPSYKKFTNDGLAMGAYGWRWRHSPAFVKKMQLAPGSNQLEVAVELLRKVGNTRQAVICMWDAGDLVEAWRGEWRDLPCTLTMQFILRGSQLHMITNMRSNDVWLGMPYDVFCFTAIQAIVANELEAAVGTYTHCVGSMHLYDKDGANARTAMNTALSNELGGSAWKQPLHDHVVYANETSLAGARRAVEAEAQVRCSPMPITEALNHSWVNQSRGLLGDCVKMCWGQLLKYNPTRDLHSDVFKSTIARWRDRKKG